MMAWSASAQARSWSYKLEARASGLRAINGPLACASSLYLGDRNDNWAKRWLGKKMKRGGLVFLISFFAQPFFCALNSGSGIIVEGVGIRSEAVIFYKLEARASGLQAFNGPLAGASSLYGDD